MKLTNTKRFGYARVSTTDQNLARQIDILCANGVKEENIYKESISGAKRHRPELNHLQTVLRTGDVIVIESLSRLSRTSCDLLEILRDWEDKGIQCISLKEQLDFSSTTGKLMLTVLAALSQFERDIIRDRVKEGLAAARARGRVGGRPKTDTKALNKALKLYHANTHTLQEIREVTGVTTSVLYRALRKQATEISEKQHQASQ